MSLRAGLMTADAAITSLAFAGTILKCTSLLREFALAMFSMMKRSSSGLAIRRIFSVLKLQILGRSGEPRVISFRLKPAFTASTTRRSC